MYSKFYGIFPLNAPTSEYFGSILAIKKSMKIKSYKLAKLEKNRTSILTDKLDCCFICGRPKEHLHEVFFGRNRINSMKYDCVVPLCSACHDKVHNDIQIDSYLKKTCQRAFIEVYDNDFISIFRKNYL